MKYDDSKINQNQNSKDDTLFTLQLTKLFKPRYIYEFYFPTLYFYPMDYFTLVNGAKVLPLLFPNQFFTTYIFFTFLLLSLFVKG